MKMKLINLKEERLDFERKHLKRALEATRGNVREAAKLLTMPERTLWNWIERDGVELGCFQSKPPPEEE